MTNDFLSLLKQLVNKDVKFVVVGGFASIVHGCTYVTEDIDICCEFSVKNLLRLQDAVSDFHPVHHMTAKRKKLDLNEENCRQFKNLYLDTNLGQLDCISFVEGIGGYKEVKQKSVLVEIERVNLYVLDIEALIESKKAMSRQSDLNIIKQLETIKRMEDKS
jgi:predicted nucleotidyltransferase